MLNCPCGSNQSYENCCAPYIQGKAIPDRPETLMRSRYTAYTQANIDYIEKTMRGRAAQGFDKAEAETWAKNIIWLGLEVLKAQGDQVEFKAYYSVDEKKQILHEISEFKFENGRWYYVDGLTPQAVKVGRNEPCACGSQKKYKKCCGK